MKTFLLLLRHQLRLVYRDRNTRIYGLLLPLVLYPLLLFFAFQGKLVLSGLTLARSSRVLLDLGGKPSLERRILREVRPSDRIYFLFPERKEAPLPRGKDADSSRRPSPEEILARGGADAVLTAGKGRVPLRLLLAAGAPSSERAARRVRSLLARIQEEDARRAGIVPPPPPRLRIVDLAPPGEMAGKVLGRILPLILFVMISLGAFFPALEATAGEWERSTLETNLLLPVARETLLAARVAAVVLASMATAGLNILGMLLAAGPILEGGKGGLVSLSLLGVPVLLSLGFLLAVFFSSLFLLVCSRARSFREGQALGTPFLALAMLPGLVPLLPGIDPGGPAWSIPLAGEALAVQSACAADFQVTGPVLVALGRMILLDVILAFAAVRYMERRILPFRGKEVALR